MLTPSCVVWSTTCSSSCCVTHLSNLVMRYLPPRWHLGHKAPNWAHRGATWSVVAALRFQKQPLLPYTILMAAVEVGNSKRKQSTETCISPPDRYWFTKLFALRRQKTFLSDFKLETWMVPGAKGEVMWWHKACIFTSQMGRESFDVMFELCEPINFYPKIFFLLLAGKVCVPLPNSAMPGETERTSLWYFLVFKQRNLIRDCVCHTKIQHEEKQGSIPSQPQTFKTTCSQHWDQKVRRKVPVTLGID